MPDLPPLPYRLAQTIGLTSSLFLAGQAVTLSTFLIPRLLESPTPLMLRQWSTMFHSGKKQAPPFAALAAFSYFYLAYQHHLLSKRIPSSSYINTIPYAIAGVLAIAIVPYTLIVIGATNNKLLEKVEETKSLGITEDVKDLGEGNESAHALVDWWGMLNLGRGALLVGSGVLGTWTALHER